MREVNVRNRGVSKVPRTNLCDVCLCRFTSSIRKMSGIVEWYRNLMDNRHGNLDESLLVGGSREERQTRRMVSNVINITAFPPQIREQKDGS